MNFEIKYKDGRGRMGTLSTPHGKIKTPCLMPVIHPGKQKLKVKDLGAEMVITNSYIIYKNEELRETALKDGVHRLIDFEGPIMTDSGSFQLSLYGDIDVSNREIIEFQEKIGTDIGTSLDIPTPPFVTHSRAEREMMITLERAKEALKVRDNLLLNSVVQGSTYPDLRSRCAQALGSMGFDLHPIGAVVPLMEGYRYRELVEIVMASVPYLPDSRARHLMGAGHPMVFALAVAMGCDLFDSAAYILYAEDDRLLMPQGTHKLENLVEMPCSCNVCSSYSPPELRSMEKEDRALLLAEHNLAISFAEIRQIRQALNEGSLWELVEQRCHSHPYLLDALRSLRAYSDQLEVYDPPYKKSAFFYAGPESLNRPEIIRHQRNLKRTTLRDTVVFLPSTRKPYSQNIKSYSGKLFQLEEASETALKLDNLQFCVVDIPLGVVPLELDQVYPMAQNEAPNIPDMDSMYNVKQSVLNYAHLFKDAFISEEVAKLYNIEVGCVQELFNLKVEVDDLARSRMIADYQFGAGSGTALFDDDVQVVRSRKTGKIRHLYHDEELIATLRASDGVFVLAPLGAVKLHDHLPFPGNRVVVNQEAEPFAREGKSIFAKFVINCDIDIHAHEEVLVVNENDELLAFGKAVLGGREIQNFSIGQAVKTRKGGF
jgi:7-cyano-7-deazaguanine tRNA-ribosyltransferase